MQAARVALTWEQAVISDPRRSAALEDEHEGSIVADIALPIVLGTAAGVATGVLVFGIAVMRLGLMSWIWP